MSEFCYLLLSFLLVLLNITAIHIVIKEKLLNSWVCIAHILYLLNYPKVYYNLYIIYKLYNYNVIYYNYNIIISFFATPCDVRGLLLAMLLEIVPDLGKPRIEPRSVLGQPRVWQTPYYCAIMPAPKTYLYILDLI